MSRNRNTKACAMHKVKSRMNIPALTAGGVCDTLVLVLVLVLVVGLSTPDAIHCQQPESTCVCHCRRHHTLRFSRRLERGLCCHELHTDSGGCMWLTYLLYHLSICLSISTQHLVDHQACTLIVWWLVYCLVYTIDHIPVCVFVQGKGQAVTAVRAIVFTNEILADMHGTRYPRQYTHTYKHTYTTPE